jgi:hypothetical protein
MHRVPTCLDLLDNLEIHILLNPQLPEHSSVKPKASPCRMSLSYLVSTAGHAQDQNDENPHDIVTLNQLVRQGARELQDRPVVGFAVPKSESTSASEKDGWGCEQYCKCLLILLDRAIFPSEDDIANHPVPRSALHSAT